MPKQNDWHQKFQEEAKKLQERKDEDQRQIELGHKMLEGFERSVKAGVKFITKKAAEKLEIKQIEKLGELFEKTYHVDVPTYSGTKKLVVIKPPDNNNKKLISTQKIGSTIRDKQQVRSPKGGVTGGQRKTTAVKRSSQLENKEPKSTTKDCCCDCSCDKAKQLATKMTKTLDIESKGPASAGDEDADRKLETQKRINAAMLDGAVMAGEAFVDLVSKAVSGEAFTAKEAGAAASSFGHEAGSLISKYGKDFGLEAAGPIGAAFALGGKWLEFIITHPPDVNKRIGDALEDKRTSGGVIMSGATLTPEEEDRARRGVSEPLVFAAGKGLTPAEEAANAAAKALKKLRDEVEKSTRQEADKRNLAALARMNDARDREDFLSGEAKLKASAIRLGMAKGGDKKAGELQLGMIGIAEEERRGLGSIATREGGQFISYEASRTGKPVSDEARANIGAYYSKMVDSAAEKLRKNPQADLGSLSQSTGLNESILTEIRNLIQEGKNNAEILKKTIEQQGTEQNPVVILPSSRGNVAILDANALMRQRTAGASRAFSTGGNVRGA